MRCMDSLSSTNGKNVGSCTVGQLMELVMSFVVRRRTGFGPDGGVRTLFQGSRGGVIPAFDLEALHGTMMIQSPDVVQVNLESGVVPVTHRAR
jgi:hypothetical protein